MTGRRAAILIAVLLVLGGAVAVYAKTGSHGSPPAATQATVATSPASAAGHGAGALDQPAATTDAGGASTSAKHDNSGNWRPTDTAPPVPASPAPAGAVQLAGLDCSLTAQTRNDGSISFLFYVQGPGYFTVQQQSAAGAWQAVRENVFYAGSGGLDAGSMPAGSSSATLRLLKLENGQYTAVSKQFSVSRQDVTAAGGLRSF